MFPAPASDGCLHILEVPLHGPPAPGAAPAAVVLAGVSTPRSRSWRRVSRLMPRAAQASALVTKTSRDLMLLAWPDSPSALGQLGKAALESVD
jgi:hypothetical protein